MNFWTSNFTTTESEGLLIYLILTDSRNTLMHFSIPKLNLIFKKNNN